MMMFIINDLCVIIERLSMLVRAPHSTANWTELMEPALSNGDGVS